MPYRSSTGCDIGDLQGSELLNRAIEIYYEDIASAARRGGSTSATPLDIVHDLYVKLSARPDVLRDKRSLKSYLCRAAVNLGIDRFRQERLEVRLFSGSEEEASAVPAENVAPDLGLEIEARIAVLRDAIAELPKRRRAVFILHRLHQLSQDEIAAKLNISRNMVDRHLRRAFAHCLDCLASA